MKRLTLLSALFVLVLLVIPAVALAAEAQGSPDVQTENQGGDSPIESIIKKAQEYREAGKFEEALKLLDTALEEFPQKEHREKLQNECSNVHFWWAESLEKKYDYAYAIQHFEFGESQYVGNSKRVFYHGLLLIKK